MNYRLLATDFDGTLVLGGPIAAELLAALERVRRSGRRIVLVTGRELEPLLRIFPEIDLCDRVVAENGAVLYDPHRRSTRTIAPPPAPALVQALLARGVRPLSVGASIIATVAPHQKTVLEAIRHLGLDSHIVLNKGAVMVLPAGIDKAFGLRCALTELAIDFRCAVAIGDAENDLAFFRSCGHAVAVANALEAVKVQADYVSRFANGAAVAELVDALIDHDLQAWPPRAPPE